MSTPETREKVVHNYTDRSTEADPEPEGGKEGQPAAGMDHNFPMKLHYMLSSIEGDGQGHIVSWQPHGRCFMVHDMKEFVASMLPLWFRQSKFASFQRQLNLYGFQRLTQGRDKNAYYHEYFLRGRPLLAQKISRTKVKGKGARRASSPETEPQLYDFPWMESTQKKKPAVSPSSEHSSAAQSAPPSSQTSSLATTFAHLAPAPNAMAAAPSAFSLYQANSPTSLGDALGLLSSITQVQSAMPSNVAGFGGRDSIFLTSAGGANPNALNSLLSSFSAAAPGPSSAASRYIPIAPAPPAQGNTRKPILDNSNNYATVLAALKAQHSLPESGQQNFSRTFTKPGPAPF